MGNKPSDYLGLLVSINNTAPFIDEKFSDEIGIVVAHEGPRVEQVEHARLAWGEDYYNNYNHLYRILTVDGTIIKLFTDEFTIISETTQDGNRSESGFEEG